MPSKYAVSPPHRHIGLIHTSKTNSIVGVVSPGYAAEKVSYGLPVKEYIYRRMIRAPFQRLEKKGYFWKNTPVIFDNSIALLHTFNEIPITTHPFVITFENELPRYLGRSSKWQIDIAYKLLNSKRCRRLLALSQICADNAKKKFENLGMVDLVNKIQVFRGGVLSSKSSNKRCNLYPSKPIKALFVGGNALNKGLVPTIEAIQQCRDSGIQVELTVISYLNAGKGSVLKEYTPDADMWRCKLSELDYIRYLGGLPNHLVRKEMADHDILLFPSFDESLGWVIVEAGLEGIPTLATNIYAIPELIKDEKNGFIVKLDLGKENRWQGIWEYGERLQHSIDIACERIRVKINEVMERISDDRSILIEFGKNAKKHMESLYDRTKAAQVLESIYQDALN